MFIHVCFWLCDFDFAFQCWPWSWHWTVLWSMCYQQPAVWNCVGVEGCLLAVRVPQAANGFEQDARSLVVPIATFAWVSHWSVVPDQSASLYTLQLVLATVSCLGLLVVLALNVLSYSSGMLSGVFSLMDLVVVCRHSLIFQWRGLPWQYTHSSWSGIPYASPFLLWILFDGVLVETSSNQLAPT